MTWDPAQYLKYAGERLRPALDLIARIDVAALHTIVDLGCGAGNVTRILAERWPEANVVGLDNSAAMLAKARTSAGAAHRLARGRARCLGGVPRPPRRTSCSATRPSIGSMTIPHCSRASSPRSRGEESWPSRCPRTSPRRPMSNCMRSPPGARWRSRIGERARPVPVASSARYFEWLAPMADTIDTWTTEYLHVLAPGAEGEHPVVAWTRGTALTPFLEALAPDEQQAFVADYAERIRRAYPPRADGRVLFPFRRLFIVATRTKR